MINNKLFTSIVWISIVSIYAYLYFPGLLGGYILDDVPNLSNLNVYSRFDGLDALIRYIMSYNSGPLKRPISTLSFLLNADRLTVNAFNFKVTNLLIHIVNGFLLYLVNLKILKLLKISANHVKAIAMISMIFWLFHPLLVSTTLYVIQRMAMLPVTFILGGMYCYLKGREDLFRGEFLNIYTFLAIYVFTTLAVLSKENGIILPFLLILIEVFIIPKSQLKKTTFKQWSPLIIPSVFIVLAFSIKMSDYLQGFEYRDFTLLERLLTESRILVEYLFQLFIPAPATCGVFCDGYTLSKSMIDPISTLFALIFIVGLLYFSLKFRNKYPLLGFGIFFYFVSHVIESTFVPLELYFEHRNYLASLFLFLPIISFLVKARVKYQINYILLLCMFLTLISSLSSKVTLWSSTKDMVLYSAENFPNSIRAIDEKSRMMYQDANVIQAIEYLDESQKSHKNNISLKVNAFNLRCFSELAKESDFESLLGFIEGHKISRHDAASILGLLNVFINNHCLTNDYESAEKLINTIKLKKNFVVPKINKVIISSEIYLLLKQKKNNLARIKILDYLLQYHDFQDVINMIVGLKDNTGNEYISKLLERLKFILNSKEFRYTDKNYLLQISKLE